MCKKSDKEYRKLIKKEELGIWGKWGKDKKLKKVTLQRSNLWENGASRLKRGPASRALAKKSEPYR